MRKLTMLAAVVAVLVAATTALAGQGATNSGGDFTDLSVRITPPVSGTSKVPQGVGISFDSFTGNRIRAADVHNSTSIKVVFHDNFTDNALLFPACKINPKALSKCAKKTQIGSGSAEGETIGADGVPAFIPAELTAYNGKPYHGKAPSIIFIASLNGTPATELDFTVKKQGGSLAFTQIQFPSSGGGPSLGISKFSVDLPDQTITRKVKGKKVKVHLLEAPTRCHGAWTFSQTNTFAGLPPLTATDSEPCVKG
jgi:hypothetical protein